MGYIFAADGSIFIQILVVGFEKYVSCNRVHNCRPRSFQGRPRSSILVPIESACLFDFLLMINSNLCRILYRFGDNSSLKVENRQFVPTPPSFSAIVRGLRGAVTPSNFRMNSISPETRIMELPYGEETMIVGWTMWTLSTSITGGRTEGRISLRWLRSRKAYNVAR